MAGLRDTKDQALSVAQLERAGSAVDLDRLAADLAPSVPVLASLGDMRDAAGVLASCTDPTWVGQHRADVFRRPGWGISAGLGTADGRTFRVQVSPGVVGLRTIDQARAEQVERPIVDASTPEQWEADHDRAPSRQITEWSSRSRARMVRRIGELDLSKWLADPDGGDLGLVTFSLPRQWLLLAPTGRAFKCLIDAMRKRWTRAGLAWVGLWKLELQERGAPHLHALMRVPALVDGLPFETWVRRAWANLCLESLERRSDVTVKQLSDYKAWDYRHHLNHGVDFSPSVRYSDPRRIAIYFAGHSLKSRDGKEYQHVVPEAWQGPGDGPGRFWGYWGLGRAVVEVDVSEREAHRVARVLRKIAKARARNAEAARRAHGRDPLVRVQPTRRYAATPDMIRAARLDGFDLPIEDGDVVVRRKRPVRRRRPLRSLGSGGRGVGGFVLVNDGQALTYDLARLLGDQTLPSCRWCGKVSVTHRDSGLCDGCAAQRSPEVVADEGEDRSLGVLGHDVAGAVQVAHRDTGRGA